MEVSRSGVRRHQLEELRRHLREIAALGCVALCVSTAVGGEPRMAARAADARTVASVSGTGLDSPSWHRQSREALTAAADSLLRAAQTATGTTAPGADSTMGPTAYGLRTSGTPSPTSLAASGLAGTLLAGGDGSASQAARTALFYALAQLGDPYLWGGNGPDVFDCSGLVQQAYLSAGVRLPRVAADQARIGQAVDLGNVLPGDLLFWAYDPTDPATIHHVAMYVGGGLVVQAPQTGDVVRLSRIWTSGYAGAVRVTPAAPGGGTGLPLPSDILRLAEQARQAPPDVVPPPRATTHRPKAAAKPRAATTTTAAAVAKPTATGKATATPTAKTTPTPTAKTTARATSPTATDSAGSAGSAGSARSARSAGSAGSAGSHDATTTATTPAASPTTPPPPSTGTAAVAGSTTPPASGGATSPTSPATSPPAPTSTGPATPAQPSQPVQPSQPAQPSKPAQSSQPAQPGKPAQPASGKVTLTAEEAAVLRAGTPGQAALATARVTRSQVLLLRLLAAGDTPSRAGAVLTLDDKALRILVTRLSNTPGLADLARLAAAEGQPGTAATTRALAVTWLASHRLAVTA